MTQEELFSQPNLNSSWLALTLEQTLQKSGTFTKIKAKDYTDSGIYPVVDQGAVFISGYINDKNCLYQGELPLIIFGDHTRNIKYINFPFAVGADGTKILKPIHWFNDRFYYYYLKCVKIADLGYRRHYSILKQVKIPLPPLAEQERIVAKLDTLFAQLDTMCKSMNKIPTLFKDFRQQVLTQAVTGKLTEEWREGKELEEWREELLINLIQERPRNGYSPISVDYVTDVKSLSLSATTSGTFDATCIKYLDIEKPNRESHLWLLKNDILIQRSNSLEYVGTSAIYTSEDYEFIYPDIMMKIRANDKIDTHYLNYVLSSLSTKSYYRNNATGTAGNMPKINQQVVSNTTIPFPSLKEQQQIVRCVESLFAKADAIEAQYKTLKTKIEQLPQAILHKAFKGELVPQLPSDGDAKGLLKKIMELKK